MARTAEVVDLEKHRRMQKRRWEAARRVAHARDLARMSQEGLAEALTELTGVQWSRRMVQRLEDGSRNMTVDELHAIGEALGRPPRWFVADPYDVTVRKRTGGSGGKAVVEAA